MMPLELNIDIPDYGCHHFWKNGNYCHIKEQTDWSKL
jgi:hypothetical protein